ncbi:glycoside hydrolase family 11 protein [Paractinoplanes lichenicola]|uniref:Endo-1,4-beta-xylanase n=1 Tax=Paractinoplanes lichenicola TaxID=2802976 RepID=A0ABS1W0C4_9ACTN|nr:glycoside hydrolase family 11 protein [Actinoplanes lichenicola]MBL7260190.1 glycoside hydrolase family 11 protein [Actinoplanes lichenicola]
MDQQTRPSRRRRGIRALFGAACAVTVAVVGAVAVTEAHAEANRTLSGNETGYHNGYFFSYWKDSGNVSMTLGQGGNYSVNIQGGTNNWVGGKGWNPGARRVVNYSGSWSTQGNGYLALYGWTRNPLVEYYVVENYGNYNPASQAQRFGSVTTDGSTYDLYRTQRVNKPSIEGNNSTFYQYWSIRQQKRTGGTITVGNHFDAWTRAGLQLGNHDYQIMATEGYQSTVQSNITVSEGSGSNNPTTSPTTPPGNGGGGCTASLSAGDNWSDRYNLNVSVSGSSNWTVTMNLVAPQTVMSTWNTSASWPSQYQMVAKPNGSGNNFGVTIAKTNGSTTWPSVSCQAG